MSYFLSIRFVCIALALMFTTQLASYAGLTHKKPVKIDTVLFNMIDKPTVHILVESTMHAFATITIRSVDDKGERKTEASHSLEFDSAGFFPVAISLDKYITVPSYNRNALEVHLSASSPSSTSGTYSYVVVAWNTSGGSIPGAEARISRTIYCNDIFGESIGRTNLEIFLIVSNLFNTTGPVSFYTRTGTPDRNGTSLDRLLGEFPVVSYFDKEDPNRPETVGTSQFDRFGTRHYNPYVDINMDGVVTQAEKYAGYQRLVATVQSLRGNYDQPRTFTLGMRLRF